MIIGKVKSDKIGRSPNHMEFNFQVTNDYEPRAGDFVRVRTVATKSRFILGQVSFAHAGNPYLSDPRIAQIAFDIPEGVPQGYGLYGLDNWEGGTARIIGTINDDELKFSGHAPKPGDEVEILDPDKVGRTLGIPDTGIFIGTGYTGDGEYRVNLDIIETLSHNMLICGRIGSGKTYAGGVIMEEFLENGIPIVAIDPHGELGSLSEKNDNGEQQIILKKHDTGPKSYNTRLLAPKKFAFDDVIPFAIPLGLLTPRDIMSIIDQRREMGGIQESHLARAMEKVKRKKGMKYTLEDLAEQLKTAGKDKNIMSIVVRLNNLTKLDVFNQKYAIDPSELVKDNTATIITLPGVDDSVQSPVVAVLARQLLKLRMANKVSRFLFYVDEGHMFAPTTKAAPSKGPLIRFAKECRKFGAGLCMASQQPADISDKIRSQCHTRIFLQLDSQSDMKYVRSSITDHWKDLVEMIPYFQPGEAILRAKTLRFPLSIKIRPRRSKHGSATGGVGATMYDDKYVDDQDEGSEDSDLIEKFGEDESYGKKKEKSQNKELAEFSK